MKFRDEYRFNWVLASVLGVLAAASWVLVNHSQLLGLVPADGKVKGIALSIIFIICVLAARKAFWLKKTSARSEKSDL